MNNSALVFLINDDVRAVSVSYEPLAEKANAIERDAKTYIFKTMDQTVQVGDMVVVETNTRHGFTVCKVEDVDIELDYDTSLELKWIVGVVDQHEYANVLSMEKNAIAAVQAAERRRKREELKKSLFEHNEEMLGQLQLSSTASTLKDQPEDEATTDSSD